jgi:predicted nuclease of restriction endonuclease-like (RecB) superfamily
MADEGTYEIYKNNEKLSPLVRELPWTHNVIILYQIQSIEEKTFYLKNCINERMVYYSKY